MAPEQALDPGRADIRADVYSLGCTLYHLLAGRPPFPEGTPLQKLLAQQQCPPPALPAARADVPRELEAVLERMLAKDPARRQPTAADVAADLARFVGPAPGPRAPSPRRFAWPVLLAAAAVAVGSLTLPAHLAPPAATVVTGPEIRKTNSPAEAQGPARRVTGKPPALATAEELADQKRKTRDRAVAWLRAQNRWGPGHPAVADVAAHLDRDLNASEAFQVMIGSGLVKSGKPTLLAGRAGALDVFELSPELTRDSPFAAELCGVKNYSAGDDLRRRAPRVLLSGAVIDGPDRLFPERRLTGSVTYRILGRWRGACALRLTHYFGTRQRAVLLGRDGLPGPERGTLSFTFPPLGEPHEVTPGPDVVFVELVTQDSGRTVVESNAASAPVRVMPPTAERP
jgi:hypothetical protein